MSDIRSMIYDSCYDEAIDMIDKAYENLPEHVQKAMKQHDNLLYFLALREVFHLIDLMELGDREKLEFRTLTNKGQIQIEAAEKTYNRIQLHLLDQMKKLASEITDVEGDNER